MDEFDRWQAVKCLREFIDAIDVHWEHSTKSERTIKALCRLVIDLVEKDIEKEMENERRTDESDQGDGGGS